MSWTPGTWFNGRDGLPREVAVLAEGATLQMRHADGTLWNYRLAEVYTVAPFSGLPQVLELPGGGTVHLAVGQPMDTPHLRRAGAVLRVASAWWSAALCILALVLVVVGLDQWLIPRAATRLVQELPPAVDRYLGGLVLNTIDREWLRPTKLDLEPRRRIEARFREIADGHAVTLVFRSTKDAGGGFNAMALPGGTVVVLDGLVRALTPGELEWVLAHELGHVVHRHGMKGLARAFGTGAVASALYGDFSMWIAAMGSTLPVLAHGREAEREADAFMRALGPQRGLDPKDQLTLWKKFVDRERSSGAESIPRWFSTHPPTEERLDAARAGARPVTAIGNP